MISPRPSLPGRQAAPVVVVRRRANARSFESLQGRQLSAPIIVDEPDYRLQITRHSIRGGICDSASQGFRNSRDPGIRRSRDSGIGDSGLVMSDERLIYRYGDSNPGPVAEN